MWKLNKQVVFLQGATSNPGSLPEWASLLGGIMLCGHHLDILNDFTYFFFFFNSEKTFRTCTLALVRSSLFPPSCPLLLPWDGFLPSLLGTEISLCAWEGPFSLLPCEDQGLHWAYCVGSAGQALAVGGLDRARMGEPTLAACLLLLLWVIWLASLPICSQVPCVPKGEVFNPLEVTINSGFQGCPLRRGNCFFKSQLGPCIFISSQVPPIMSWSYSLLVTVRNKTTVLFSSDWPINEEVAFSNDEITKKWVLISILLVRL